MDKYIGSWFFISYDNFYLLIDVFIQFTSKMIIRTIFSILFVIDVGEIFFRSYDSYMFNFWGTTKYFFQKYDYVCFTFPQAINGISNLWNFVNICFIPVILIVFFQVRVNCFLILVLTCHSPNISMLNVFPGAGSSLYLLWQNACINTVPTS